MHNNSKDYRMLPLKNAVRFKNLNGVRGSDEVDGSTNTFVIVTTGETYKINYMNTMSILILQVLDDTVGALAHGGSYESKHRTPDKKESKKVKREERYHNKI